MELGTIQLEIKSVDESGKFSGIASVYDIEDLGGDIIEKGAFTKTLREKPDVPILWQHDSSEVIGKGRVSEQGNRIVIDGELDLEDPMGQKAYRKMKGKLVSGLSIGFIAVKRKFDEMGDKYVRRIQELKLVEVSVVTFPMLPAAQITSVKNRDEFAERITALEARLSALEEKAATPAPAAPAPEPEPVQDHSAIALALTKLRLSLPN